jgi:hypothetical protein
MPKLPEQATGSEAIRFARESSLMTNTTDHAQDAQAPRQYGQPKSYFNADVAFCVPNWLHAHSKELSWSVIVTWCVLRKYCGRKDRCWPKQEKLADAVGISIPQLQKNLKKLAQLELIRIEQRGLQRSNHYVLLSHCWEDDEPLPEAAMGQGSDGTGPITDDGSGPITDDGSLLSEEGQSKEGQSREDDGSAPTQSADSQNQNTLSGESAFEDLDTLQVNVRSNSLAAASNVPPRDHADIEKLVKKYAAAKNGFHRVDNTMAVISRARQHYSCERIEAGLDNVIAGGFPLTDDTLRVGIEKTEPPPNNGNGKRSQAELEREMSENRERQLRTFRAVSARYPGKKAIEVDRVIRHAKEVIDENPGISKDELWSIVAERYPVPVGALNEQL